MTYSSNKNQDLSNRLSKHGIINSVWTGFVNAIFHFGDLMHYSYFMLNLTFPQGADKPESRMILNSFVSDKVKAYK